MSIYEMRPVFRASDKMRRCKCCRQHIAKGDKAITWWTDHYRTNIILCVACVREMYQYTQP